MLIQVDAICRAAKKCPADEKKARVSAFAHKLVENDGPAVSMMEKLFGKETMQRIVLRHMYGVCKGVCPGIPC